MKKILFCITSLNGGGAERALANITLAMPEDVIIDILVNCENKENDYVHRGTVISCVKISKKKIRVPFPLKVFIGRYYKLRELKKIGKYDACISFMDESNIANILTGNKYCKVLISERTTLSQVRGKEYDYKIKPLAKRIYKNADKIIAVSQGVANDLNSNFNVPIDKLEVIYNGFNINSILIQSLQSPEIVFEKNLFYFLNTGRVDEAKGQWHLIRAFAAVEKRHPEVGLIICGQGPYLEMLQEMTKEYHLQGKILFLGFVKNPYAISKKSDVFVFPSMYEGMPNALIENMICGLPVIATDFCSSAREILAPDADYMCQVTDKIEMAEYGIIVPVCSGKKKHANEALENEERLLAEAMLKMVEDDDLRLHYKKQSEIRAQDFSIDKKILEWLEIIN